MKTFSDLLIISQQQYMDLVAKTKEIGEHIHDLDSETIRVYQKELSELLDRAQKTDEKINELSLSNLNNISSPLFHERTAIMKRFLELNRSVASRLTDKQAVIRSEYLKVKNGRSCINGYQSSLKQPHRFVDSSA